MGFVLGLINIIVAGAVLISMAILHFQGERSKSNLIFLVTQGMVVLWCISQAMQILAETLPQMVISYLIGNLGICFIGTGWLYFSLSYTGKKMPKALKYIPIILSAFFYAMILTNPLHHLYYSSFTIENTTHGPVFYLNAICTYLFVLYGSFLLYQNMKKEQLHPRRLVIASVLIPILFNAFYLLGWIKSTFDITPLGFAFSVFLIMLATTKYEFINLRRELTITNEKLLLEQERNRIAQQVHDTAGHTLTMIQSYMKLAEISASKNNYEEVNTYLTEARALTGNGIRELRESINMLRQTSEYELVTQGIMQLAAQVKEIPVEVTVKGEDNNSYSHLSKIIYDTVREAITNTLKYAEASKMDIVIRFRENDIELLIADDGKGCEAINDNNGLRGIKERIQGAKGTVRFTSSLGEGFMIRIQLPIN